ncbi:MAG: hypothetical protein JWM04_2478, partial [Verrucomicrobiales bacterium]|nr:hypothetical protein [Verrucomicrobiales bacterium]
VVISFLVAAVTLRFRPQWWLHFLMAFLGLLTGCLNLSVSEAQAIAFMLLVFGFFSGFAASRRPWVFPIILATWVPGVLVIALFAGVVRGAPYVVPQAFLAFVPASVGTALGVLVRGKSNIQHFSLQSESVRLSADE